MVLIWYNNLLIHIIFLHQLLYNIYNNKVVILSYCVTASFKHLRREFSKFCYCKESIRVIVICGSSAAYS